MLHRSIHFTIIGSRASPMGRRGFFDAAVALSVGVPSSGLVAQCITGFQRVCADRSALVRPDTPSDWMGALPHAQDPAG